MSKPVGGRGLKANYDTTHSRIPTRLKELVDSLSNSYKEVASTIEDKNPIISVCQLLPLNIQKEIILTALKSYIEAQQSSPGGNQHRRKDEPLDIEKARDWKHFRKFMKEIEKGD